jgi:integrase
MWWIRYCRNGRRYEESTHSAKKGKAIDLLKLREGDIARGVPVTPKLGQLRFEEAAQDVINDYRTNGKRSLKVLQRRITKHLEPFFGGRRMASITTSDIRQYIAKRQSDSFVVRRARRVLLPNGRIADVPIVTRQTSNGEINRELTTLKRAFSLAIQAGKLITKPHIPLLQEDNVRTGFFEPEQYVSVIAHLPTHLRPVITFAYVTGWRIPSEVLTLEWRQIDFAAGEVRLDPGQSKNREGRLFPFTPELRSLLEAQCAMTVKLAPTRGIIRWVFHRLGRRITKFPKSWRDACVAAGCPGRIPHDLRRTAVRNLVRAGVPESVAMKLTGHKTRSVFERYNIVSDGDLRDAVTKLAARSGTFFGTGTKVGQPTAIGATVARPIARFVEEKLEAPPGFEPGVEVLQTSALPLGDGASKWLAGPKGPRCIGGKTGAGNGIRTRDFDLGKVALYH